MTHLSCSIRRCLRAAAVLAAASFVAEAVHAETAALEEIVVTAQKRQEKLSETPLSVTVLTNKDLQALGATQFRDFANTVPGLSFTTDGPGASQVNLRGITTGGNVSPTVGIYVDEVPYGSSTPYASAAQLALDVGLFDISRIEVLRGPQGTLYGASTMGGLLKYVSIAPDTKNFGGTARAGIASTEEGGTSYDVAGVVNVPFATDKAAARMSGYYSHDGGFIDNTGLNKDDVNQADIYGGRADFLFAPTDKLSVRLTAFLQEISRDGGNYVDYVRTTGKPVDGSLDQYTQLPEPFDQQFELFAGTLNYDFDGVTLTSITSYQSVHSTVRFDLSPAFAPLVNALFFNSPPDDPVVATVGQKKVFGTDKFTEELRLSGTGTTLDWLIGEFFTHENNTQFQNVPMYDASGDVVLLPLPPPFPTNLFTVKLPSTYQETAAFGTLTWHATATLDLSGGLRYARNLQTYEQIGSGLLGASLPEQDSSDTSTTYLADLRYRPTSNLMAYLRYATGYRPGGPNVVLYDNGVPLGPPTFNPDKLQSYEGGIKSSTSDGRFSVDAAIYWINWEDIQVIASRNNFGVVANAGTARSKGAELTLTAVPIPELSLVGAFGYTNAELTSNAPDLGAEKGDPLPNTPEFTAAISADYSFNVAEHPSGVGATFRYIDDRNSSYDTAGPPNFGAPQYKLPSYTTFDLRGSVGFGPAELRLYVRNLLDERGQISAGAGLVPGQEQVSMIQPRTIGMSVDYTF